MPIFSMLFIALALAMDAFAVAVSLGAAVRSLRIRQALLMASSFGLFQAAMPLVGWFMGQGLKGYVTACDHWIVFGLLVLVGGKMIRGASRSRREEPPSDPLRPRVLVALSIATSIDALAVGITLSLIDIRIVTPVLVIGAVTFILSFLGPYVGAVFGSLLGWRVEIVGGMLLIGIGVKILIQHLLG